MRVLVKLVLSDKNNSEIVTSGNKTLLAMTDNPSFPKDEISPPLKTFQKTIEDLSIAESNKGKGPQSTEAAIAARKTTEAYYLQLANYVENVANDPKVNDNDRVGIVLSAAMEVKSKTKPGKIEFKAKPGKKHGSITLTAPGIKYGTHEWQQSTDQTGTIGWIPLLPSTQATCEVGSLDSGIIYAFRHRTVGKDGPSNWDGPTFCRPS